MHKAVQFGAGKIGRGFLGQLLFEGGYRTTFVDADTALVDALNARGEYPLRLVSDAETQTLRIGNLRALDARRDSDAVMQAVVEADLVSVAVGANVLPHVAPALAAGLNARALLGCGPVDILLCENQWHAATLMRGLLEPYITPDARLYFETQVGLVETVIGRMVPMTTEAQRAEDPLLVVAEPYKELPIARAMLRGEPPSLPGLILADNFEAYEARKLYLHNMSHAALAYLGCGLNCRYIWQCATWFPEYISDVCRKATGEVSHALVAEYGFEAAGLAAFNVDLMRRFANKALGDTVARVAADPIRKLGPNDRLIGAANLCLKHGITPSALARVIWAAFRNILWPVNPDKLPQIYIPELEARRQKEKDEAALAAITGIAPGSDLAKLIFNNRDKEFSVQYVDYPER